MEIKKILIVEDQPIVALDYRILFEVKGYDCAAFSKGRQALESIKSDKPDLALLDIKLQDDVSGIEIGKVLKLFSVPTIFISAFSDTENHKKAVSLQPAYIFTKPINFNELNKAVEKILNKNLPADTD
jgi:DNA-binding response OmpR family regulator